MASPERTERDYDAQASISREGVFTCFAHLPKEIQLTIWEAATKCCTARILNFAFPSADRPQHLVTDSETPALLLTCQGSRRAALQVYKLCNNHAQSKPYYMNLQRDAILLEDSDVDCLFQSLPKDGLDSRLGILALHNMSEYSFHRVHATLRHSLHDLLSTATGQEQMSNSLKTTHDYSFREIILIYDDNPPKGVPLTSDTTAYFNLLRKDVKHFRKLQESKAF